jgi:hypothetical protein
MIVYVPLYLLGLLLSVTGFARGFEGISHLGLIIMSSAGFLLAVRVAKKGVE